VIAEKYFYRQDVHSVSKKIPNTNVNVEYSMVYRYPLHCNSIQNAAWRVCSQ